MSELRTDCYVLPMDDIDFDTLAVHGGEAEREGGPVEAPLVLSSAFSFLDAEDAAAQFQRERPGFIYTRWRNPSVEAFEAKMAALEGAGGAAATASGMGAIFGALAATTRAGGRVFAAESVYAETAKVLRTHFVRFGVEVAFVDTTDLHAVERALAPGADVLWCETPANPVLAVSDIGALAARARAVGACLVVDSTFATPFHQRALRHGADLVVHSATKAIGGHGDAVGGVVCGGAERIAEVREAALRGTGNVLAPFDAFLLSRGLGTLGLRMARASESAAELARRLEADARIAQVHYPGLPSHPQAEVAKRQMERGFGAVLAFELKGGGASGRRAYDRVRTITRAVSLGDLRSLITHPATTTHASMPASQREAAGIGDGLMRLAVGIEGVEDLWADLDRAME